MDAIRAQDPAAAAYAEKCRALREPAIGSMARRLGHEKQVEAIDCIKA